MMRRAALLAATLGLASCAITEDSTSGPALERYRPSGASGWALTFDDPVLADLLHRADAGALDVKMALARLEGAQAALGLAQAEGGLLVTAEPSAAVGQRDHLRKGAAIPIAAQIELDIWGRLKRASEAASDDRDAAAADVAWARLLVAAQVTAAYADLRTAQALRALAASRADIAKRGNVLARARGAEGVLVSAELNQRASASISADEALRAAGRDIERQEARLAALLGMPDQNHIAGAAMPALVLPRVETVSSDLVTGRPDVRAAFARLQAADAHRAEAVAANRPRLVLVASAGGADPGIADLLNVTSLAWAAAANLSGPVFDNGASAARVAIAASEADLADLAYRRAVVTAWLEQRTAVLDLADSQGDVRAREAVAALATGATQRDRLRAAEGLAGGFEAVDLEDAALAAAAETATARGRLAKALAALTLACGGQRP